jgi:HlyD family secretion protein
LEPKTVGARPTFLDNQPQPKGAIDVYCLVEGGTTVIKMVPYGSAVKKGQVICELDSAALRDRLPNQQINELSAQANYENARLSREVAEVAKTEYVEGLYIVELTEYQMDIKNAEVELSLAEDQLDELKAQKADRKKVVTSELALKKARFALERAQSRLKVLRDVTNAKRIKQLKSDVEKAHSDELAKKAIWELEAAKTSKLKRQIEACEIKAWSDGTLVPVIRDLPPGAPIANQLPIEEGSTVRERQLLFRISPPAAAKAD